MLIGYYFNKEGFYRDKHYLPDNNAEAVWSFVFQHRHESRVLVTDAGDNIVIEMLDGQVVWPELPIQERQALYVHYNAVVAGVVS